MPQDTGAVSDRVIEYVKAHPVGVGSTVVNAILTLILGPVWFVRIPLSAIGFQLGGVVAGGSIAAWWQSVAYGGYVPAGSIFSWAQSLGAVLGAW